MRETKLPVLGTNYGVGAGSWTGTPTKVAPPTFNLSNGKVPDQAFGAQWQNYLEDLVRRQVDRSAQAPFRNFMEVAAKPTLTAASRARHNRGIGATMFATGANNVLPYVQDLVEDNAGAARTFTVTPALGTFVPKGIEADDTGSRVWLAVGTNATAPTKTIWEVSQFGAEQTSPVSGSVELICADRSGTSPVFYAFAADTNRSVLKRDSGNGQAWTVVGTRGAGAPAPVAASMGCAVGGGQIVLAYTPGGGNPTVETMPTVGGFTSATSTVLNVADTGVIRDAYWSAAFGEFMVLSENNVYKFVNPSVKTTRTTLLVGGGIVLFSRLHESGWFGAQNASLALSLYLGDSEIAMNMGDVATPPTTQCTGVYFDGSALWVVTDKSGTKRVYRSLRA